MTWKIALRVSGLLVVVALVAVGVWLLRKVFPRGAGRALDRLQAKLDEERAGLEVAKTAARDGAEAARIEVLARYGDQMEVLDVQQKAQAEKLAKDPVALARYLVRVGAASPR